MTLKEAVESGRPFKHKHSKLWEDRFADHDRRKDLAFNGYSPEQLVSNDWEILEKTSFTKEDLMRALTAFCKEAFGEDIKDYPQSIKEALRSAENG